MDSYDLLCCICHYRISRIPGKLYISDIICKECSKDSENLKIWKEKILNG